VQKVALLLGPCHALRDGMIALQTPYFIVHSDGAGFVVRIQRTGLDYPDILTMERDMDAIVAVLDRLGRERRAFCIDWREGPLRNDAPFEDAVQKVMPRLLRGYRAVAIIVRSAVGALQVKRQLREASLTGEVFQDEADAFDFLRGNSGVTSRRPTPIPGVDRYAAPNSRGERVSTAQMQAVDRVPPTLSMRSERLPTSPPFSSDRPSVSGGLRDRASTMPPQTSDRTTPLPSFDDRPSTLPPPPPLKPSRS
jgi:hypothetical protein